MDAIPEEKGGEGLGSRALDPSEASAEEGSSSKTLEQQLQWKGRERYRQGTKARIITQSLGLRRH